MEHSFICPKCRYPLISNHENGINCGQCHWQFARLGRGYNFLMPTITNVAKHMEEDQKYWDKNLIALFKSFAMFYSKPLVNTYTEYCGTSEIFDI